ncbi:TPA: DUF4224 domain-containing protein [Salmonella enterica]|nr:DUF4224 domain-containing protein [Salmonella enterica subsp. enterica serovar Abony]EEF3598252.1 DUF4224 domain-containing protein [Salmonella enterica subsp. enterica serovar Abony]HCL5222442.1 DUF4224 domain-containing protein [Salmonella enterica]
MSSAQLFALCESGRYSHARRNSGYTIPSKQRDILREAGIFFITRRDGRPRTTWGYFNNPLKHRAQTPVVEVAEPNFGALD